MIKNKDNTIDSKDLAKVKELNIHNLLDLALYIPKGYESNYILTYPVIDSINVVDAHILSINRSDKYLKITLFAKNFNTELDAIIFNYKPYHFALFKPNSDILLKGKIESNYNRLQLVQPQNIKTLNGIDVKYPDKARTIRSLLKKYLSIDSLVASGVYEEIAQSLMMIHNPTVEFCNSYFRSGYSGKYLYALKYTEMYNYLSKLSQKRKDFKALKSLDGNIDEFVHNLPFELTFDQKMAIDDIHKDLSSNIASKRIVVGDVGCGKTMVVLASAMMAYPNRSILMAPTTILANQLYEEAKKHLPSYVRVKLLTQKSKKHVNLDDSDFIIGTHALLYQELPKAYLVMIDEQHRFGTNQRVLLEQFSKDDEAKPHFLQFSATPIPRTMAMIDSTMVDFSFIKEIPFKKDISTYIISKGDFKELIAHIKDEVANDRQVIVVYPLVEESDSMEYMSLQEAKEYWLKNFDGVYFTHGKDKEKDIVLDEFKEKGKILLATTVIEVGISLPRLSTIVIVGAERLGLASLHQLRGRVSRNGLKGYCYLYSNFKNIKRLNEFANTTNGFEIAELDLRHRNSGDILTGKNQSGKNFRFVNLAEDEEVVKHVKMVIKR
jgi:ATP-dependent DNA helicase RecG